MTRLIRDRQIVEDDFLHVGDDEAAPAGSRPIVSLGRWLTERAALLAAHPAVGVRVSPDKQPKDIPELHAAAVIAIEFPRFTEGRGYSIARLLRDRERYRGELRAVGWVTREQLFYLSRSGFNAFELAPGKSLEGALEAFHDFSVTYQAAADDPRPLFRRRYGVA